MALKLKYTAYVEGEETSLDRARRAQHEMSLKRVYRKALRDSSGADRARYIEALEALNVLDYQIEKVKQPGEATWSQLMSAARRVEREALKLRAQRRLVKIEADLRAAGLVEED